ncbi:MAG: hypothetical protein HMLKMBBP_03930 [Planctomycetes bacterium]|nr:hypothetical protein [Planctomycetota bacterium]
MKNLIAALTLLASGGAAFAEVQVPTSVSYPIPPNPAGTADANGAGALAAIDGTYYIAPSSAATYTTGMVFQLVLTIPALWGQDLRVHINTGRLPTDNGSPGGAELWQITSMVYTDASAVNTGWVGGTLNLNEYSVLVVPASSFTTVGFNSNTVTTLTINFVNNYVPVFPGTGVTGPLEWDRISNPEPGTMALFGLGALGLGGMAWRRRKSAKAKAAAQA